MLLLHAMGESQDVLGMFQHVRLKLHSKQTGLLLGRARIWGEAWSRLDGIWRAYAESGSEQCNQMCSSENREKAGQPELTKQGGIAKTCC